jgi:hypothetical protein
MMTKMKPYHYLFAIKYNTTTYNEKNEHYFVALIDCEFTTEFEIYGHNAQHETIIFSMES